MTCIKMPVFSVLATPCGLLTMESFIAKYSCDSSDAFVAEEVLEVFESYSGASLESEPQASVNVVDWCWSRAACEITDLHSSRCFLNDGLT